MIALIVAGGRNWTDREFIYDRLDAWLATVDMPVILIEGEARGPDLISKTWARRRGIEVIPMPADWPHHEPGWCPGSWCEQRQKGYCMGAGARRNQQMIDRALELADEQFVFAFKDQFRRSSSHGTEDLVDRAKANGIHGIVVQHTA